MQQIVRPILAQAVPPIDTLGGIPDPIALIARLRPEDGEGAMLATLPGLALHLAGRP